MGEQGDGVEAVGQSSAIFGAAARVSPAGVPSSREQHLLIYPCQSSHEEASAASGLLLALGTQLVGLERVKVSPVVVRELGDGRWDEHPFTPDEWLPEGLGEDALIWGDYTQTGDYCRLTLWLDDTHKEDEPIAFEYQAPDFAALFDQLPEMAEQVAQGLGLYWLLPPEKNKGSSTENVKVFCATLHQFYVELFRALVTQNSLPSLEHLFEAASPLKLLMVGDVVGVTLAHAVIFSDHAGQDSTFYQERVSDFEYWAAAAGVYAVVLAGQTNEQDYVVWCIEQLETLTARERSIEANWAVLVMLYNQLGRADLAIDAAQKALGEQIRTPSLMAAYADALRLAVDENIAVPTLVLKEFTGRVGEAELRDEARLALEAWLEVSTARPSPERVVEWVLMVAVQGGDEAERALSRLIDIDANSTFIDTVVLETQHHDNLEWLVAALRSAANHHPSAFRIWLNLSRAYLLTEDRGSSAEAVEKALNLASDSAQRAEAQLVALEKELPSFPAELADIIRRLQQTSSTVYEKDLEFLEYVVEAAPDHMEGYLALAAAYRRLDEPDTGLEVLLDAEKRRAGVPEVYLALSDLFLAEDQLTLAIDYVRKGLDVAPNDVSLLAHAALLSFLSDDEEAAQTFLSRAHGIAPYHPRIVAVTRRMNQMDDGDDDEA
jgi:tetratricopeptide (TPR) repeat protein